MNAPPPCPRPLAQLPPTAEPAHYPHHHTLVGFDIAGFGRKNASAMSAARSDMFTLLQAAFRGARLGWPKRDWIRDAGDGLVLVFPDEVPPEETIDPVVQQLHAGLRRYNEQHDPQYRIALRMAVHGGRLQRDDFGLAGEPLVHLARLLDAQAFKDVLANQGTYLGLIVSSYIYDTVVMADCGIIDPNSYFQLGVRAKETETKAWVYLPRDSSRPVLRRWRFQHPALRQWLSRS